MVTSSYEDDAIDSRVDPLIQELNRQGYPTSDSCQGGGGTHFDNAYIAFFDSDVTKKDFRHIREIIRSYTDVPFRVRTGYYDGSYIDPDAGMYSIVFRGAI